MVANKSAESDATGSSGSCCAQLTDKRGKVCSLLSESSQPQLDKASTVSEVDCISSGGNLGCSYGHTNHPTPWSETSDGCTSSSSVPRHVVFLPVEGECLPIPLTLRNRMPPLDLKNFNDVCMQERLSSGITEMQDINDAIPNNSFWGEAPTPRHSKSVSLVGARTDSLNAIPQSFAKAQRSADWIFWKEACQAEMKTENQTFSPVSSPVDKL